MKDSALLRRLYAFEVLHFSAWQVAVPIIPLYLASRQADSFTVGIVVASFALPPAIFGLMIGNTVDRLGVRAGMRLGILGLLVGALVMATADGPITMIVAQMILGLSQLFAQVGTQSWLASRTTSAAKAQVAFGWLAFSSGSGWMFGPPLGGFVAHRWGYSAALWLSAGMYVLPLAVALFLLPEPPASAPKHLGLQAATRGLKEMLRQRKATAALVMSCAAMFTYTLRDAIFPLFLQSRGFTPEQVGLVLGGMAIASIGIRPFLGLAGQRAWGLLTLAILASAAGLAVLPFWNPVPLVIGVALIIGVVMGFSNPLSASIISGSSEPEHRGIALSLRLVGNRVGQLSSPLLLGWLAGVAGLAAAFLPPAVLMTALGLAMTRVRD